MKKIILILGMIGMLIVETGFEALAEGEELLLMEIPVVIAASRYEQKIAEAPAAVTIITDKQINEFGYRTLAEALRGVIGFYTSYDREYTHLGVRGYNRSGDWGNRILVMVDGHYYNENIYGSSYFGNTFGIDMDIVKKIEIIRGPSSALYGTNALFAVINVVTKSGGDINGVDPAIGHATNATNTGSIILGKKLSNDANLLVSGSLLNSDGNMRLYFKEFDDPATNNGVAENLDSEKADNYFVKYNIKDLVVFANINFREKKYPTAVYGTIFNDSRAAEIDKRSFVEIKYQPEISEDKTGLLRFYYDNYLYRGDFPFDYPPVTLNRDNSEGTWWGSEMQLCWDISPANKLILGSEYQSHTKVFMENIDIDPYDAYLSNDHPFSIWSLYLQDEIKTSKMGLTVGVRQDSYPDFGNIMNPRLGLVVNPLDDIYLKFLYGRAFRAPTPFEKYYNDGGKSSKPNINMKPEIINTYEIIYEQGLPHDSYSTISIYKSCISDLITQVTDPTDNILQYQNIDNVAATGAEFSIRRTFGESGAYGYMGIAYVKAIDESTGQILSNSPENGANAGYVYYSPDRKTSLATELIFLGQRKTLAGDYANPYLLTNINLKTESMFDSEISLKINNLFDIRYADPASGEHVMDTIAQDGRSYCLKISMKY